MVARPLWLLQPVLLCSTADIISSLLLAFQSSESISIQLRRNRSFLNFKFAGTVSPLYSITSSSENQPLIDVAPSHLTVVIPAYNEKLRIDETLETYKSYLEQSDRWRRKTSILVVDDGSIDGTSELVRQFKSSSSSPFTIDCIRMTRNQGKGAALAFGIEEVCRQHPMGLILTADADGSANVSCLEAVYSRLSELIRDNNNDSILWTKPALVNGYRTYSSASASRLIFRWGFRRVVKMACGDLRVNDSQCGFKLMTAPAAIALYRNLNIPGWSHDVEVLYRAKKLGISVAEQEIEWEDKPGSKLVSSPRGIVAVCSRMFWEVATLRWNYEVGSWRIER